MFTHAEEESYPLQQQLDRERELLERQARHEEIAPATFTMVELYTIIPGCSIEPIPLDAYRGRVRQYG